MENNATRDSIRSFDFPKDVRQIRVKLHIGLLPPARWMLLLPGAPIFIRFAWWIWCLPKLLRHRQNIGVPSHAPFPTLAIKPLFRVLLQQCTLFFRLRSLVLKRLILLFQDIHVRPLPNLCHRCREFPA